MWKMQVMMKRMKI